MLSSTSRPSIGSSSLFRKSLISSESPLFNRQQKTTPHAQPQTSATTLRRRLLFIFILINIKKAFSYYSLLLNQVNQQSNSISGNNSSGLYAQFKLESNKFIDEEANLAELLNAYSLICAENVDFLNEKIQQLKLNRNKQFVLSLYLQSQNI